jgi:membrane peptidoglycan carboxypeptidase
VTDRDGNVLEETPGSTEAEGRHPYIMTSLLEGVIKRHRTTRNACPTGRSAARRHDRRRDRCLVRRVRSDITIGVWVGYDQKKTLGSHAGRRRCRSG